MRRTSALILLASALLPSASVHTQSAALGRCAAAASAWWNGKQGIAFDDIDPDAAIASCQAATKEAGAADAWAFLARALSRAKRYPEMRDAVDRAVRAGSAAGFWSRGVMYERGEGVAADIDEATKWYRQAAERGYPVAQYNLARVIVETGTGLSRYAEAVSWLRKAANQNHLDAMVSLGQLLEEQVVVELSAEEAIREAFKWYERAAAGDHPGGHFQLAVLLTRGAFIKTDPDRAAVHFSAAVRLGQGELRAEALKSLRELLPDASASTVINLLQVEDAQLQYDLLIRMMGFKDARTFDILMAAATDRAPTRRSVAAAALGMRNDPRALPTLRVLLNDSDPSVTVSAASALIGFGETDHVIATAHGAPPATRIRLIGLLVADGVIEGWMLDNLLEGLKSDAAEVRASAVETLADMRDERAVLPLVEALRDADAVIRRAAARSLMFLGDRRAVPALLKLVDDPNAGVRAEVIDALGVLGSSDVADRVLQTLSDNAVRESSIDALGKLRDGRAVDALVKELANRDRAPDAARALGAIGDARALEPLLARLRQQRASDRDRAWEAIEQMRGDMAVRTVLDALRADPSLWREAPRHLASLGGDALLEPLGALVSDPNPRVREGVVETLARLEDPRSVAVLVKALVDPDARVRREVVRALADLGDAAAVDPLIALLGDVDASVKEEAASALASLADKRAVEPLVRALRDPSPAGVAIASALGKIADPAAVRPLLAALARPDESPENRVAMIEALGKIHDPEAIPALAALVKDPAIEFREAARAALAEMRDPRAAAPLLEIVKTFEPGARAQFIDALAAIGEKRAIPLILAEAQDPEGSHADAGAALLRLGDPRGWDVLMAALASDNAGERITALFRLAAINDPRVVPALVARFKSSRRDRENILAGLLTLGLPDDAELRQLIGSDPKLATQVIHSAKGVGPGLIEFARAASARASDAGVIGLLNDVWDWQGSRADSDAASITAQVDAVLARPGGNALVGGVVHLMAARLHASNSRWTEALASAERGLAETPDRQIALRVVLSWLKAESQLRSNARDAARMTLDAVQKDLLPRLNEIERDTSHLPLESHTLLLRAMTLASQQQGQATLDALDLADRALRFEGSRWLSRESVAAERRQIRTYRPVAKIALGFAMLQEGAAEAAQVLSRAKPEGTLTAFERNAQLDVLESAIHANLAAAATGNAMALQTAQVLADELQLKTQRPPSGVQAADPVRRAEGDQLLTQRKAVQDLNRQIAAAERSPSGGAPTSADDTRKKEEELSRLRSQRKNADKALQEFVTTLKQKHPEVAALLGSEPTDFRALRPRFEPNMRLVQYLLLEDEGWAFVMGQSDVESVKLPGGRRAVAPLVDRYRALLRADGVARGVMRPGAASAGLDVEFREVSKSLARALVEPLAPALDGVTSLAIVPNGPLHQLPFAALPWRNGYLIEAFDVRVLSSASLLAALIDRPSTSSGALILGNPTPPEPSWRPLPGAEIEATEIAAMFPGTHALTGQAANRATLVGQDLTRRVVHLAVHAEAGRIENTRLVLSDGYLAVKDVWGLSLEGAPLVVLSACETSLGQQLSGDDIVSLANGFLFAGSRAVISSLWAVEDQSTRELMTTFYQRREKGTAIALAEAQRALIAKGYGPYHWAAFVLNGW